MWFAGSLVLCSVVAVVVGLEGNETSGRDDLPTGGVYQLPSGLYTSGGTGTLITNVAEAAAANQAAAAASAVAAAVAAALPAAPALPVLPVLPGLPPFPLPPLPPPLPPLFPALSNLPSLPGLPNPYVTVTATKTVFVETTKRVTKHPVCMTVYGVKPPCLNSNHESILEDLLERRADLDIRPTAAATLPLVQETRLLAGVTESESYSEEDGDVRTGKYLVKHTPKPVIGAEDGEIKETPSLESLKPDARLVQGFLGTITHQFTKTLWVTKVEKYMDYRVTATLVAKNCVPTGDHRIPYCHSQKPAYHGSQHLQQRPYDNHWKDDRANGTDSS